MKKLDWHEVEELAAALCELDPTEAETTEIETELYNKFELNSEQFVDLLNGLTPLLNAWVSPLTATPYVGFTKGTTALFKTDAPKSDYISGIVTWIKEGDLKAENASRVITQGGKPVFEVSIKAAQA